MPAASQVYVLYVGGTFGMNRSQPEHTLRPVDPSTLEKLLPKSGTLVEGIEITFDSFENVIDSSSITPEDWIAIARRIESNYDAHDGFVIIHGTDTLAYTASALSFMLGNLSKPVVVTGSQIPLALARTDAVLNYAHALSVAGHKATGMTCIPEVIVVFADKILRGCRTRKVSAVSWDAFDSPNYPPLGKIGKDIRVFDNLIRTNPTPEAPLKVNVALNTDVIDISLYPGLRARHLKEVLSLEGVKGVVLRAFGNGNAPEDQDFIAALSEGILKGNKVVVAISQCSEGAVEMGDYAASLGLMDSGVISGQDMTPEAALTKLMVVMGNTSPDKVKAEMQIDLRGEQSHSVSDIHFSDRPALSSQPYAEQATLDQSYGLNAVSNAMLRLKALTVSCDNAGSEPSLGIYLNDGEDQPAPGADHGGSDQVSRIHLDGSSTFDVAEHLEPDQLKGLAESARLTLTIIPSPGVSFSLGGASLRVMIHS